jgi:hypothetical protein
VLPQVPQAQPQQQPGPAPEPQRQPQGADQVPFGGVRPPQ